MKFVVALLLASVSAVKLVKKDIEGHSDPAFKPHAILPNSLHAHHVDNIDSVAGPEVTDDHNSETVHRSAMEAGEPFPERRRDIVTPKYNPSFDASKEASTVPASSGDAAEAENAAKGAAHAKKVAAEQAEKDAKDKRNAALAAQSEAAKAAKEAKKNSLVQKKSKDIEGYSDPDFKPHPILPNTLHNDQMEKIDSVAGADRTDQIGESVARSAVEGGDPIPDRSRNILKNHPKSFTPDYSRSTTVSAGDVAAKEFAAKGAAINAAAEEKAAKEAKVEAEMKANAEKNDLEKIAKLKAKQGELKTVAAKEANAEELKKLEAKAAEAQEAKTKEAIEAGADTRKDADVK